MNRPKVLCVDDEQLILDGLRLHLRRKFDAHFALSARDGLNLVDEQGPFAVVVSDMRMPGMDGAAFLSQIRQETPDTTRILLTGHAEIEAAISAVNEGQIFRFLTKPCPPRTLLSAIEAGVEQNRLITSERVLLEQTLRGSIKTLTDILSLTNPVAFGRATRLKQLVGKMAEEIGLLNRWEVEVAAMLSQLGAITLPEEIAEKVYCGAELDEKEHAMLNRIPKVTERLLINIPRMEAVQEILANRNTPHSLGKEIPIGAQLLKVAGDYDDLETKGMAPQMAFDTLRGREGEYNPKVLEIFIQLNGSEATDRQVLEIPLRRVRVGMVFTEDVRTVNGALLVSRGYEVTAEFIERLENSRSGLVKEPLRVMMKDVATD